MQTSEKIFQDIEMNMEQGQTDINLDSIRYIIEHHCNEADAKASQFQHPVPDEAGEDRNFGVRLKAAIDKRMTQAGIFDSMVNSCITYEQYKEDKQNFFDSLDEISLQMLQGKSPSPAPPSGEDAVRFACGKSAIDGTFVTGPYSYDGEKHRICEILVHPWSVGFSGDNIIAYERWKKSQGIAWNVSNAATPAEDLYKQFIKSKQN